MSLLDLKTELDNLITELEKPAYGNNLETVISELRLTSLHLQSYQSQIVTPIVEKSKNVTVSLFSYKRFFFIINLHTFRKLPLN